MFRYELKEEYEHLRIESWFSMGKEVSWNLLNVSIWFPTEIDGEMFDMLMPRGRINISKEDYGKELWV
jgi:hypothetical protein